MCVPFKERYDVFLGLISDDKKHTQDEDAAIRAMAGGGHAGVR